MAKKSTGVVVDFGKEERGGGSRRTRVKEGDYRVKVKNVKRGESPDKGSARIEWDFEIVDGKFAGKVIHDDTYLSPKALYRLRNCLEAIGMNVPESKVNLPLKKLIGKELGITVVDGDPYEGKISSEVADWMNVEVLEEAEEVEEDDDEEEEDEEVEEDDEDVEDEELEEIDLEEEL